MDAYHVLKHHKSHDASNYRVRANPATCKACALCVKRCPMDALQLKTANQAKNRFHKAATVNGDLCTAVVSAYTNVRQDLSFSNDANRPMTRQEMRANG